MTLQKVSARTPNLTAVEHEASLELVRELLPNRIHLVAGNGKVEVVTASAENLESKLRNYLNDEHFEKFLEEVRQIASKLPVLLESFQEDDGILVFKRNEHSTHRYDKEEGQHYVEVNYTEPGAARFLVANIAAHELAHYFDFDPSAYPSYHKSLCPQHIKVSESERFNDLVYLLLDNHPEYFAVLEADMNKRCYFTGMRYELFACLTESYMTSGDHPPEVVSFFKELQDI